MADKGHRDEPSVGGRNSLFKKCSLTLSEEILSHKDDELLAKITTKLEFKIISYPQVTIEKEHVTEGDITELVALLRPKLEPRLGEDYEIVNLENDEVSHQVPESDGAEKSYQAVKKEDPKSLESFEQISGPSDVTEESQSPEKIGNALKDSVAPQPANSQDEIDNLNNMFKRSLSLSESQTGDSSSRSTSQIMTGMVHQNFPANLEPTSSEEKREYVSAPCQYMPSSQPVVSQPTGAASITSQKSDCPKRMMPHPPVDGKRDKQSTSGNQQKAENVSSTDTRGVRGIKDNDHEGSIGEMSSQEKEMPDGKIPQLSGHEDCNGGSGAENEGKVKNGQRNNSARQGKETARDGKIQAVTASSQKTNKPEKKTFEEGHGKGSNEAMDESDVTDVDSLGSDTEDRGKCAMPNHGNEGMPSDEGKRGSTEHVSAGQELVKGRLQVQGQSLVTNQPYGMEQSEESDLPQLTRNHGPVVNQDRTENVEMTPVDKSNTMTDTTVSHDEMVTSQGSAYTEVKDDQNAAGNEYPDNLAYADQQIRKTGGQHQGGELYQESEYVSDEDYKHKPGRPGEQMLEAEKGKARGHRPVNYPFGQDIRNSQARSTHGDESHEEPEEQWGETGGMNQMKRPEQHSGYFFKERNDHEEDTSLRRPERQARVNRSGEPDDQTKDADDTHQMGSIRQQGQDSNDEDDSDPRMDKHKEQEKQRGMTGNMDEAGRKNRKMDSGANQSDKDEREKNKQKKQAEINVLIEQSYRGSEKQEMKTRNMHQGGKTKEERMDDVDKDKMQSPHEDDRYDSQESMNELRGSEGHTRKKEECHSVRGRQKAKADKYNSEKTPHVQGLNSETSMNEHKAQEEQKRMTGGMQKSGGSKNQSERYTDKADQQRCRISHSALGHQEFNPRDRNIHPDDAEEGDSETPESDSQSSAGVDNSKRVSSKSRKENGNSSGTSEDEATDRDLNNSKSLHANQRSQLEEMLQEHHPTEQTDRHTAFADSSKCQTTVLAKSESDSDDENRIEYIIRKIPFRLARKYLKGFPEHQYFDKAEEREEGHLFSFSNKDTEGARFLKALRKLKFEIVGHAYDDKPKLKVIADNLKSEMFDVRLLNNGSKSFLVGPKEKIPEVKQKFLSMLQETDEDGNNFDKREEPRKQRNEPDISNVTDSSSRSNNGGARPKKPEGSLDKNPYSPRNESEDTSRSYQAERFGNFGRDAGTGVYTGRYSDIKVHIHNADITKLPVNCIVNAANTRLKHAGGVARAIATAAGRELQKACETFISSGKTVDVTGVFVSPGGDLPAKHVLHAVGPKWDLYKDKDKCTDDLRRTVLRCLVEAMRLGMSSIALPSISAAIFKVPKEHCARSYMNAVKHFDEITGEDTDYRDCTLKDIHFVDVDDTMVNCIRECFMTRWREPSDSYTKQADEKVFQEQLKPTKSQPPGNQFSGHSQKPHRPSSPGGRQPTRPGSVPSSSVTGATAKSVEKDTVYLVGGLQLRISSRPALSIRSDLVITVGEEFDKLSGIPDYNIKSHKKPCDDVPKKKNCYAFSYVHKPRGNHGQLLCRLLPDPKSPADLSSAFGNLDVAIRLAALRGDKAEDVKSFVLTSSVLYAEPNNTKKKTNNVIDRKLMGNVGKLVFDYVEKMSKESSGHVKLVVVAASEEASVGLCKILESRDSIKKINTSAPGAHPHFRPRGESPSRRGAGSGGSSTSSSSSRQSNYSWQSSSGDRDSGPSSTPGMSSYGGTGGDTSVAQKQECEICASSSRSVKPVSCCQKLICATCENRMPQCPYCFKHWRIRTGDQPDGKMTVEHTAESADGYERKGSWKIRYYFPDGYQKPEHPNPGKMYKGTSRTAYIPAIEASMNLLKMLRLAFIRRLTFTVGRSRTIGEDNRVTWNDIHHKTSLHSGGYGYPDHTYFHRVVQELTDRGVTLESMTEAEYYKINSFERNLTFFKRFSDYDAPVPMSASHYYAGTPI